MHKMLTALVLGATIATSAVAQDRRVDDDRRPRAEGRRDGGGFAGRRDGGRVRDDDRCGDRDSDDRDARNDRSDRNDPDDRFDRRRRDDRRADRDGRGDGFARYRGDWRWTGDAGAWNRDWRWDRRHGGRDDDRAFPAPRYPGPRGFGGDDRRWSPGYRIVPAY